MKKHDAILKNVQIHLEFLNLMIDNIIESNNLKRPTKEQLEEFQKMANESVERIWNKSK